MGVPQGSVLGLLPFILCINEIPAILAESTNSGTMETSIHGYADDLQLFSSCTVKSLGTAVSDLGTNCQMILDWFTKNKLKANPDKFQCIIYGTRQQLAKISRESKTIPGVSKKVPPFDQKKKRRDKISQHSKNKTRFVNLQLRCTYLAFLNRPPNTKDAGSQSQNLECTENQRFCEMA